MDILIIGPTAVGRKKSHPGGQLTAVRELLKYCKTKNLSCRTVDIYISHFPRPKTYSRFFKSFFFFCRFMQEIIFYRPKGVIIFTGGGLGLYEKSIYSAVCRLLGVKCALLIRDGFFINNFNENKNNYLIRLALRIPNFIVAQGKGWKDFYENNFKLYNKVEVIHNWAPMQKKNKKIPPLQREFNDKIVVLYAGWLVKEKGVMELLDVIEKTNKFRGNAQFILAGSGDLYDHCLIEKKRKKLDNLFLPGWCDKESLEEMYESSDIFVLPSHAEGFPNVIVEAMSHSLPIISTNVGAISDSVINEYNGYCIEPKNADVLYEAIMKLVESKEKREIFGANSLLMLKKNHDPEICCSKLLGLFGNYNQEEKPCVE